MSYGVLDCSEVLPQPVPVQCSQVTEQPVPVDGQVWSASREGQSCSQWRGLVREESTGAPSCWSPCSPTLLAHVRRAALPCPVCPSDPRAAWQSCECLKVLLQLVLLCSEHRAGSLHSVLVSPGCRGCHMNWPVCTPCKITGQSVTPGGSYSRRGSSSAWVNEWHP